MKAKITNSTLTKLIVIILFLGIASPAVKAQADRSMYFLPILPNARIVNPAIYPKYNFYIGVPFLSSVKTGFENTFNYDDIFQKRGDSLYLDREYLLSNLDDKNIVNLNFSEEVLSFGFKARKNYFHFRIADIINSNVTITKDLLRFGLYGNGSDYYLGKTINLSGNAVNMTYYREFSLGFTRQINPKINAGINLKYLQGIANAYTKNLDVTIETDPNDFTITAKSNIVLHSSLPGNDGNDIEPLDVFTNTGNSGFAIDFGGSYNINDKFTASASLLNLGSIKWEENLKSYKTENPSESFVFDGFDLNDFINDKEINQERITAILDSIQDELGLIEVKESYRSKTPSTMILNLDYNLTQKDRFGFIFGSQFLEKEVWPTVSLGYTRNFNRNLNLMLSYTASPQNYFNLGIGVAANAGPVQFYVINENFTAPFMLNKASFYVLRFGISLVFGKNTPAEIKVAEPAPEQTVQ
jgi:hypothetical protein